MKKFTWPGTAIPKFLMVSVVSILAQLISGTSYATAMYESDVSLAMSIDLSALTDGIIVNLSSALGRALPKISVILWA